MRKKIFKWLLIFTVSLGFSGCQITDYFNSTPKCSDEEVQNLVKDIYLNVIENSKGNMLLEIYMAKAPQEISSLSSIRAVSFDQEVNLRECKAVVNFENASSIDLEYTVQLSEDGNEFYVEFKDEFTETLMTNSMMSTMLNQ